MFGVGVLGADELDELNLLKLMLTDDAAGIAAGRSSLGAEAGRVGGVGNGQAGVVEDFVAEEVGDGDLGGGDEPVVVVFELPAGNGFGIGVRTAE